MYIVSNPIHAIHVHSPPPPRSQMPHHTYPPTIHTHTHTHTHRSFTLTVLDHCGREARVSVTEATTLAALGELLQLPEAGVTALLKVRLWVPWGAWKSGSRVRVLCASVARLALCENPPRPPFPSLPCFILSHNPDMPTCKRSTPSPASTTPPRRCPTWASTACAGTTVVACANACRRFDPPYGDVHICFIVYIHVLPLYMHKHRTHIRLLHGRDPASQILCVEHHRQGQGGNDGGSDGEMVTVQVRVCVHEDANEWEGRWVWVCGEEKGPEDVVVYNHKRTSRLSTEVPPHRIHHVYKHKHTQVTVEAYPTPVSLPPKRLRTNKGTR